MSPVKITSIMSAACIAMTVVFSFLFHALCPVENLSGGVAPLMVAEAVFALVPAMITESLPAGRKREASFLFLAVSLVLFASSVIIISVSATAAAFWMPAAVIVQLCISGAAGFFAVSEK